jgi:hypothetical protein
MKVFELSNAVVELYEKIAEDRQQSDYENRRLWDQEGPIRKLDEAFGSLPLSDNHLDSKVSGDAARDTVGDVRGTSAGSDAGKIAQHFHAIARSYR